MTTIERTRWAPLTVLLTVLIAVLTTACGGSSGDDGNTPGEGAGSSPASTAGSDNASGENAGTTGGGAAAGSASVPGACLLLTALFDTGPTSENPLSSTSIGELQNLLGQLATQGPDAIQADLQVMASSLAPFFDTLDELGVDTVGDIDNLDPDAQAQLTTISESLSTAEVRSAEVNIGDYIDSEC